MNRLLLVPPALLALTSPVLGQDEGAGALLPARLGPLVETSETLANTRLDPLEYRHPLVEAFRGKEQAGLLTTPIQKYIKLLVPEDSSTKVALANAAGDPLIVEKPFGRGRVVLVATSADISWTPMPMWPSYVPIVQELLAFAVGGRRLGRNVTVGEPLSELTPWTEGEVSVQTPDGATEPVRLRPRENRGEWTFSETSTSGIYTAAYPDPAGQMKRFAVNLDTVESDLARLGPEELREEVWPGVPLVYQTSWDPLAETASVGLGRDTLAKEFLYGVLSLLFLETYLAWRFGHHAT